MIEDGIRPHVDRFLLDGSNRTHLIETEIRDPMSLSVDPDNRRLYWTDHGRSNIESIGYDGEERRHFRHSLSSPYGIALLRTLAGELQIYWTDNYLNSVYWSTLDARSDQHHYIMSKFARIFLPITFI